jgi:hypothetical protein
MARIPPRLFVVQVELDGKSYSTTCSSFSGVVTLLHPVYNRWGATLRRGIPAEVAAHNLFRGRLESMRARGQLF